MGQDFYSIALHPIKSHPIPLFTTNPNIPIEIFLQPANLAQLPWSNKPEWLLHLNLFLQVTMQENVLNVKLIQ